MQKIRAFAATLQTTEISSNLSYRLCTAEARGSSPLGSTNENGRFAGKTQHNDGRYEC
jgi:hypothetical protein